MDMHCSSTSGSAQHVFECPMPLQALRHLSHPNIVKLKEVIRENNELYFVFEYMVRQLHRIMKAVVTFH